MFTFSSLSVSQSGCSSVCPSHTNYKHFTKFRRRIKHMLVTKGHNPIKKLRLSYGSHYLHSICAVYLNYFCIQISFAVLIWKQYDLL